MTIVGWCSKLDFARIREYRREVDADEEDNDDESVEEGDPGDEADVSSLTGAEDPWDWDINLDSNLLYSVVPDSTPQQADATAAETLVSAADASQDPIEGEWSELDF